MCASFSSSKVFDTLACLVMILHVVNVSFIIHPSKSMGRVSIYVSVAVWCSAIAEKDSDLMKSLRRETPEIESHVGVLAVVRWVAFLAVDEVGELDRIFYKEDWSVVANHVVVAFFRVVFDCEATRVSVAVVSTALAGNSRKAKENWCLLSDFVHELCPAKAKAGNDQNIYTYCLTS